MIKIICLAMKSQRLGLEHLTTFRLTLRFLKRYLSIFGGIEKRSPNKKKNKKKTLQSVSWTPRSAEKKKFSFNLKRKKSFPVMKSSAAEAVITWIFIKKNKTVLKEKGRLLFWVICINPRRDTVSILQIPFSLTLTITNILYVKTPRYFIKSIISSISWTCKIFPRISQNIPI